VVEETASVVVTLPPGFEALERRVYGDTAVVLARFAG